MFVCVFAIDSFGFNFDPLQMNRFNLSLVDSLKTDDKAKI